MRQQYRIVEALIETELARSYLSTKVDVIPRRVLPPQALVIALTPLLDQRTISALLDLRARGFDLAVVDVSPVPVRRRPSTGTGDDLAWRLWTMWRKALHHRYERVGVPVVEWSTERSLLGRDRGGDGIQTSRAFRLRLALIATAAVAAFVVVLAPLLATGSMRDDEQFLPAVALAALVFPLAGVARLLPWAVALLAGSVLVAAEHGDIGDVGVALCAALLLLVAECASTAGNLAPLAGIERRLAAQPRCPDRRRDRCGRRARRDRPRRGVAGRACRPGTLALGLLAAVLLLALVAVLVARR